MKASTIMDEAKQYIRNNPTDNGWTVLSYQTICSQLEIPAHVGRSLIAKLRLEPDVRTKLKLAASRFKPREFCIGTPEEKIKDIKSGIQMFEFNDVENKKLISDFYILLKSETLKDFLVRMYICERFKTLGAHKKWTQFNPLTVSKDIDITATLIDDIVSELMEKHLIIRSPYTLLYRLTISKEEYDIIHAEVNRQSTDPRYPVINSDAKMPDRDNSNSTSTDFSNTVRALIDYNNKISTELNAQIKLLEGLERERELYSKHKIVFNRLNNEYQSLTKRAMRLEEELKLAKEEIKATDEFLFEYQDHITRGASDLMATLTSTLEKYFQLPTYKKNDMSINNDVKVQLTSVILEYQKNILKYGKEKG